MSDESAARRRSLYSNAGAFALVFTLFVAFIVVGTLVPVVGWIGLALLVICGVGGLAGMASRMAHHRS